MVSLDPAYKGLLSTGNQRENGEQVLEMEWEMRSYPREFWPIVGDHVWVYGRWIFDCGHEPYPTEIHPPLAIALTRLEPSIFGGDVAPSLTTKTYVYVHGAGGYHNAPAANRDYEFDIPLPAPPSASATLHAEVVALPFGGPRPLLTLMPTERRVHVRYPLTQVGDPSPNRQLAAVVVAGWREPVLTRGYRELRVTLTSVKIKENHAPLGDGRGPQWQMWVQAGPQWLEILRTRGVPGLPDPSNETGNVDDDETVKIQGATTLIVADDGVAPVTIRSTGWESDRMDNHFGIGRPNPADLNAVDENDRLGVMDLTFGPGHSFGVGTHNERSKKNYLEGSDDDTEGDFELRFQIELIRSFPPGTPTGNQVGQSPTCLPVAEAFKAEAGPSVDTVFGNSRVTVIVSLEPVTTLPASTQRTLLFQLPQNGRILKLTGNPSTRATCQFDFSQVELDFLRFEPRLNESPYEAWGSVEWAENRTWRQGKWGTYGMQVFIREEFYYTPKGKASN